MQFISLSVPVVISLEILKTNKLAGGAKSKPGLPWENMGPWQVVSSLLS